MIRYRRSYYQEQWIIDLLRGSEEELQQLTERLEKTAAGYDGNQLREEHNSRQQHQAKTTYRNMDERRTLEEVDQFKYVGSTQIKGETSIKEVKIRLTQAHSVMTSLAILWKNNATGFHKKIKLY